jgi:ATP-binding cassette subfamily B protein
VLEGVSLSCEPGSITAIIGPTGSGKSTLAALVPRFYDATAGAVLVGGVDVRSLDLTGLRGRIALVPQKTVLFTGTIAENIRWGREDATNAELEEAARAAAAHEFIAGFPEGYESVLGQGGVNLSGGQKQRVAIARALIRAPEVLVLDDCTSSVDSITEGQILAAIRGTAGGLTCILITQRISAAVAADRVLVLDDGRVAGVGTHAELIRTSDVYRDICAAQLGREALDGPR